MFVQCDFTFHVFVVPHARLTLQFVLFTALVRAVAADRTPRSDWVDNLGLRASSSGLRDQADWMTRVRLQSSDLDSRGRFQFA
jgi:hypothetical protein